MAGDAGLLPADEAVAAGPGVKALLLAAGLGTRLRPLTDELPKPAWPLFDVPLAAHVLAGLHAAGVRDAVVNLHHLPELLQQHLVPWVPADLRIRWSPERHILGTGGALWPWREHFASGTFVVANADTYQDVDLARMIRCHHRRGGVATLLLRRLPTASRAPIEVDTGGRIVRFLDAKAPGSRAGEPCDFSGVHVLEPEVLQALPAGRSCINADLHAALVRQGAPVFGYLPPEASFWSDLGTPARYLEGHVELLRRGEVPRLAPGRIVAHGDVVRADGAEVRGPSCLGSGVELGPGAVVGPFAVVGRGARVGAGARVERAVLWPKAEIAARERVREEIRSDSGARLAAR